MPTSGKEMVKLYKKAGWQVIKGQGKGSHVKMKKNNKMQIIPMDKELAKGTEKSLLKALKKDTI